MYCGKFKLGLLGAVHRCLMLCDMFLYYLFIRSFSVVLENGIGSLSSKLNKIRITEKLAECYTKPYVSVS